MTAALKYVVARILYQFGRHGEVGRTDLEIRMDYPDDHDDLGDYVNTCLFCTPDHQDCIEEHFVKGHRAVDGHSPYNDSVVIRDGEAMFGHQYLSLHGRIKSEELYQKRKALKCPSRTA